MASLKEMSLRPERFTAGHRLCAGCGIPIFLKILYSSTDYPIVTSCATGCLEVGSSIYPYSSWKTPWIHSAFENSAATIAGAETMYQLLKKKGKIDRKIRFVGIAGDGGTYDIGLQALSGAFERNHDMLFICYNNEAYMNTGIQRSSATPFGASTTTTPAGMVIPGKMHRRKNLTEIMVAHHSPYVAQGTISHWKDLARKFEKALNTEGPTFINVLTPCVPGWLFPENMTVKIAKLAVETCAWPLYEVENGKYRINYIPREKKPVIEWISLQGRFRHLKKEENRWVIEELQRQIDEDWNYLQDRAGLKTGGARS